MYWGCFYIFGVLVGFGIKRGEQFGILAVALCRLLIFRELGQVRGELDLL